MCYCALMTYWTHQVNTATVTPHYGSSMSISDKAGVLVLGRGGSYSS